MSRESASRRIVMGRIIGLHGIAGWMKVLSWTRPMERILDYPRWQIRHGSGWQTVPVVAGRRQGKGLVARLEGVHDRDAAGDWIGRDIAITRSQLPPLEPGEYYWSDLEGLRVETLAGEVLGVVHHLIETGANDVLVVRGERERLIPFTPGEHVVEVDLEAARLRVDWDPDF